MAAQTRMVTRPRRSGSESRPRWPKHEAGPPPPCCFRQNVAAELRQRVIWPTRRELITYTVVCVTFVTAMMIIVTVLDYGFTKLIFEVFG